MAARKSLPARPSLESLRKQAKKLSHDRSVSLRDAQLVLAREYGFAGWQDLIAEVSKRLGNDFEWALTQAHTAIHNSDLAWLKKLLGEYPALLSWQGDQRHHSLMEMATGAYGDAFGAEREHWFTRAAAAELLIEQGAIVLPQVAEGILQSRAVGLLHLFQRKGLLPRTLRFFAALGDLGAVRAALEEHVRDRAAVNDAFMCACRFEHEAVASFLLERSTTLDPELGTHIDESVGRLAFIRGLIKEKAQVDFDHTTVSGPWQAFNLAQVRRAAHGDLAAFVSGLQREPWMLGEEYVWFQVELIDVAALNGRGDIIAALLELNPAMLRRQPPPKSNAIEWAIVYQHPHLLPLLTRIWPLPDDLPHAAGTGNLSRVKRWFDEPVAPAQDVLDTALAWSVINRHFDVADFLLAHGANINTDWNSHEPASILHHLVFLPDPYESMQYLIDRGIDMTIEDYRWNSTAIGWARYANSDEKMAKWLEDAERQRR